jgi:hypothetical protein
MFKLQVPAIAATTLALGVLVAPSAQAAPLTPGDAYTQIHAAVLATDAACQLGYTKTTSVSGYPTSTLRYDAVGHAVSDGGEVLTSSRIYDPLSRTAKVRAALALAHVPNATYTYIPAKPNLAQQAKGSCASFDASYILPPNPSPLADGWVPDTADTVTNADTTTTVSVSLHYNGRTSMKGTWAFTWDTSSRITHATYTGPAGWFDKPASVTANYTNPKVTVPSGTQAISEATLNQALVAPFLASTVKYYAGKTASIATYNAKAAHRSHASAADVRYAAWTRSFESNGLVIPVHYKAISGGVTWWAYNPFTKKTTRYNVKATKGSPAITHIS